MWNFTPTGISWKLLGTPKVLYISMNPNDVLKEEERRKLSLNSFLQVPLFHSATIIIFTQGVTFLAPQVARKKRRHL
jgi:hypothetical protein